MKKENIKVEEDNSKGVKFQGIFLIVLVLLVVAGLLVYFFVPYNTIEFQDFENTNFTINNSESSLQFYPNMRFQTSNISYKITACPLIKKDEMLRAFNIMESETSLNFYEVVEDEQITIICDSQIKFQEGGHFIAGEGGPVSIVRAGSFNVILNSTILLIRESKCGFPNIAMHELLHAIGFDHSENPANIMYPVSKCGQKIGIDIVEKISEIYSYESLPDLTIENASAVLRGKQLDVELVVRNYGLQDAPASKLKIFADKKLVDESKIDGLGVGSGSKIILKNIFVVQFSVGEITLLIETDFKELEKINNEKKLNVKV